METMRRAALYAAKNKAVALEELSDRLVSRIADQESRRQSGGRADKPPWGGVGLYSTFTTLVASGPDEAESDLASVAPH